MLQQGGQPGSPDLGRASKAGRGVGKRKGFRPPVIGGCSRGDAEGRLTRNGVPDLMVEGAHMAFPCWS